MPAVTVPRLGWSMEEGKLVRWLKADGDHVRPGEPLFELESDKATEAIEAIDEGILYIPDDGPKPGDTVKVGQVLGLLVEERAARPSSPLPVNVPVPVPESGASRGESGRGTGTGRGKTGPAITPRARRAAREMGIDYRGMHGTGRGGRIRERDVRLGAVGVVAEGRLVPHTSARQVIAARMLAGVNQAAPVTLTAKADVTDLVALRPKLPGAPSFTAVLIRACGLALREHPALRAQWRDDGLLIPEGVHVAFAVDTAAGLFAPVIRDADRVPAGDISRMCKDLAAQARDGTLTSEAMRGAVFTVSNLGMFGVEAFTPIITLPQCAVLGVGRVTREPAVVGEAVVIRERVALSLTFDHRVTDGAPAARFLDAVRGHLEKPWGLEPDEED